MSSKKVIIGLSYGRISKEEQVTCAKDNSKNEISLQAQELLCQNFLRHLNEIPSNKGLYQIDENIRDDSFSEGDKKLPGFQNLIKLIKSGKINFVITSKLSRLSCNTLDFLDFFKLCTKHSVEIIIIDLELETGSYYEKLALRMLLVLAEIEYNVNLAECRLNLNKKTKSINKSINKKILKTI